MNNAEKWIFQNELVTAYVTQKHRETRYFLKSIYLDQTFWPLQGARVNPFRVFSLIATRGGIRVQLKRKCDKKLLHCFSENFNACKKKKSLQRHFKI